MTSLNNFGILVIGNAIAAVIGNKLLNINRSLSERYKLEFLFVFLMVVNIFITVFNKK